MRVSTLATFVLLAGLAACDSESSVSSNTSTDSLTASDAAARAAGELGGIDSAGELFAGIELTTPDVYLPGASDLGSVAVSPVAGRSAGGANFSVDFSDTAGGRVAVIVGKSVGAISETDTVVIGWRNGVADTTSAYSWRGARVWGDGIVERYSLLPVTAGKSLKDGKIRAEGVRCFPDGSSHRVVLVGDAGDDRDFDASLDNRVWAIDWARWNGFDTVARASVRPFDAAKPISGPGASALFVAQAWEGKVVAHPRHDRFWKIVARVQGSDTLVLSVNASRRWVNGRVDTLWTENASKTDSVHCWIGDTAKVVYVASRPSGDSFAEVRIEVLTHLLAGLGRKGDATVGLSVAREHRAGAVARSAFSWTAKTEVPEGRDPVDGSVSLKLELVGGRRAGLEGELVDGRFRGTWTSPDGDTATVDGAGD